MSSGFGFETDAYGQTVSAYLMSTPTPVPLAQAYDPELGYRHRVCALDGVPLLVHAICPGERGRGCSMLVGPAHAATELTDGLCWYCRNDRARRDRAALAGLSRAGASDTSD